MILKVYTLYSTDKKNNTYAILVEGWERRKMELYQELGYYKRQQIIKATDKVQS